jgi:hypothetical protein
MTIRVPAFVVIGGGTIGHGSARQLLRARDAGRLETDRIVVVDRNPACAAASLPAPVELAVSEWGPWLRDHLARFGDRDHLVPDHWAPHLLRHWLAAELESRGATLSPIPVRLPRSFPFERETREGKDRALSYATWLCPPRCIEPALCPHTRGAKDWSLARDLAQPEAESVYDGQIVFPCLHLVYGIGTVPIAGILAARDRVLRDLEKGPRSYLLATGSHCHGLASAIRVEGALHSWVAKGGDHVGLRTGDER